LTVGCMASSSRRPVRSSSAWRAAFRPHAIILTEHTCPAQITMAAVCGADRNLRVDFEPGSSRITYVRQALDQVRRRSTIQFYGRAICVIVNYSPDDAVRFGLDGNALDAVRRREMDWIHLPIKDVSVPDATFENDWGAAGEGLRARLRSGFDVLLHCRGGLGRGGLVGARLLIELGAKSDDAIEQIRQARPGAIETAEQERYVRATKVVEESVPSASTEAIKDRAVGALLGLAIGDAVGAPLSYLAGISIISRPTALGRGNARGNAAPCPWAYRLFTAPADASRVAGAVRLP
jgi:ADP-ribosyl-[dinitrogen reductase] hydrolase